MTSHQLVSRLEEVRPSHKPGFTARAMQWLQRNARPAAPDKPLHKMSEAEFDRVPLI